MFSSDRFIRLQGGLAGEGNGAAPLPVTNKQSTLVFSSDRFIRLPRGLAGGGNGAAPLPVTNKQSTLVFPSDTPFPGSRTATLCRMCCTLLVTSATSRCDEIRRGGSVCGLPAHSEM